MSDFFGNLRGARFPDVVMNSGPLPPTGGLPAPLHDTPDGKINYNSTLLGDLQPYAYGEPAYQSSQNAYLNTPHRVQKIVPVVYLPEPDGSDLFRLSHAVDDSDLAFAMRLNRKSIFCTGTRVASNRSGLGTVIDPLVNLATLNYMLAGIQYMPAAPDKNNLWWELLFNMDPERWPEPGKGREYLPKQRDPNEGVNPAYRNLSNSEFRIVMMGDHDIERIIPKKIRPIMFSDLIHFVRKCVRPFGIVRGSEKQGGQNEMTNSPATWPVPAVATLVIDGKEANIVNIWHNHDIHAGDDLVLRFKLMPIHSYTLNHYYKGFVQKSFKTKGETEYAWQLVPDIFNLEIQPDDQVPPITNFLLRERTMMDVFKTTYFVQREDRFRKDKQNIRFFIVCNGDKIHWQNHGYWHIGRSQVMMSAYGTDEFYNNDMANSLKTNHLEMTFEPVFGSLPLLPRDLDYGSTDKTKFPFTLTGNKMNHKKNEENKWQPTLRIEANYTPPNVNNTSTKKDNETDWDICKDTPKRNKTTAVSWSKISQPAKRRVEIDDNWDICDDIEPYHQISNTPTPTFKLLPPVALSLPEERQTEENEEIPPPEVVKVVDVKIEEPASEITLPTPGLNKKPAPAASKATKGRKGATVVGTVLKPDAASESCEIKLI